MSRDERQFYMALAVFSIIVLVVGTVIASAVAFAVLKLFSHIICA